MDARDLTKVLVKVLGLSIFAYAIFDLPAYFLGPFDGSVQIPFSQRFAHAISALLLPIVFGLLLWLLPGTVVNRIVSGPARQPTDFGAREFEKVALTVLGLWLAVYGVVELLSGALSIYFASRDHPGAPLPGRVFVGPVVAMFKTAVGLVLVIGVREVQRWVERVRARP